MDNDELARDRHFPVEEDMRLQRRVWRVERLGWGLFGLIVVLALLGVFSHGPLSKTELVSANGDLLVEYERFTRNGAVGEMTIHARSSPDEPVNLSLQGGVVDAFTIETIQPEPIESRPLGDGQALSVASDKHGSAIIRLSLKADSIGYISGSVTLIDGPRLDLAQFIYP